MKPGIVIVFIWCTCRRAFEAQLINQADRFQRRLITGVRAQMVASSVKDFLASHQPLLAETLTAYLSSAVSHKEVQARVDDIFSAWEASDLRGKAMTEGESVFWCALWSTQHLATSDHWRDGVAQRELALLQAALEGTSQLPASYVGRRP